MSSTAGRNTEQQTVFIRQSTILRKNLQEFDRVLRVGSEDWPTMLGRLNAAMNQTSTMNNNIEDVMEHFCYLPKKSTANANDIPFFLSTRLETPAVASTSISSEDKTTKTQEKEDGDPVKVLAQYEKRAANLAAEYEAKMIRF